MPDMEKINIGIIEDRLKNAAKTAKLCGAKGGAMDILYTQGKLPQLLKDLGELNKNGTFISYLGDGKGEQMSYRSFVFIVAGAIERFSAEKMGAEKFSELNRFSKDISSETLLSKALSSPEMFLLAKYGADCYFSDGQSDLVDFYTRAQFLRNVAEENMR